ncbi:MAG: hypothetical protein LBC17_00280 [Lactobacillaceae bacterium]|jgi:hypothetical protein|nr:hypothetical protein [Lactobacillaceae bacterium]
MGNFYLLEEPIKMYDESFDEIFVFNMNGLEIQLLSVDDALTQMSLTTNLNISINLLPNQAYIDIDHIPGNVIKELINTKVALDLHKKVTLNGVDYLLFEFNFNHLKKIN